MTERTTPVRVQPMSSSHRTAGRGGQKRFRLGCGYRIATGKFFALYAASLSMFLSGATSFVLILGDVLHGTGLATVDGPLTNWFVDHRTGAATAVLAGFAFVFGPLALPVITLVTVVTWARVTRRLWRPLLLAAAMVAGVILTEVIAHIVGRSRPPAAIMMLGADGTSSFPSGHVVGASNFLLIGAYLLFSRSSRHALPGAFCAAAAGMTVEAASRIYLGYHWLTDTVASASLSVVLLAAVIMVDISRGRPAGTAKAALLPLPHSPALPGSRKHS